MTNSICPICGGPERVTVPHTCPGASVVSGRELLPPPPSADPASIARRRYLLTVTLASARVLESWLGGPLLIVRADARAGIPVAGLDAVASEEVFHIHQRIARTGPPYHAGGPH